MPKILYVYDALCGWSYGFSPVIRQLYNAFSDRITFDVLSGGVAQGSDVKPIAKSCVFIRESYPHVEAVTGIRFGEAFLNGILAEGSMMMRSSDPASAICLFKHYQPHNVLPFALALQEAFYRDGKNLTEDAVYAELATSFGLNGTTFAQEMKQPEIKAEAEAEFASVEKMGIPGLPALIWVEGHSGFVLTHGYAPFEELAGAVEQFLYDGVPSE